MHLYNNYNRKNKLTENNQLLRNIKEKKINGKFDISKSFTDIKKIKPLLKSDYTTNKKISYFINKKNKDKKNGAEISEKIKYNESDIFQ